MCVFQIGQFHEPRVSHPVTLLKIYPLAAEHEKGPGAKQTKQSLLLGRWGGGEALASSVFTLALSDNPSSKQSRNMAEELGKAAEIDPQDHSYFLKFTTRTLGTQHIVILTAGTYYSSIVSKHGCIIGGNDTGKAWRNSLVGFLK